MNALRIFFLTRALREKLLLVGFVVALFAIWFSSVNKRAWRFRSAVQSTSIDLADQKMWLSNRQAIEDSARRSAANLDPARTLNGTRLLAAVTEIAAQTNLKNWNSNDTREEGNGQFMVHTLQFYVTKVDWETLRRFYLALQQRSPYIAIAQFSLNSASPGARVDSLNATLRISSVEVVR